MQAPQVSGDMLVKLVLGAVVLGATYYAVSKGLKGLAATADTIKGFAGRVTDTAVNVVQDVNPLNHDNVFATSVNKVGGTIAGNDDWSLGSWIYDVTHPEPAPVRAPRPNENYGNEGRNYATKYTNPLVNDQGYDFGQLSG